MSSTILIDGDIIVNKAAFFAERRSYFVLVPEGNSIEFKYKKDATAHAEKHNGTITLCKEVLPESYSFMIADSILKSIKNNLSEYDDMKIIIGPPSGTLTFRHQIAKTRPYKGNRKIADKAVHLKAVRDYLVRKYNAVIVYDMETDDLLGILQTDKTIIASIDKDLLQIPGKHYNINTGKVTLVENPGTIEYDVTKKTSRVTGTGFKWFCAQMLLGDSIDNIQRPIRGFKTKKVYDLLKDTNANKEMWAIVVAIYKDSPIDIEENAQLLWILKDYNLTWKDHI